MVAMVAAGLLSSCSPTDRARKALTASDKAFAQARSCLLSGDNVQARVWAGKSKTFADKAAKILPGGPFKDRMDRQVQLTSALLGAFDDPTQTVKLTFLRLAENDFDLIVFIMNPVGILNTSLKDRNETLSKEERETLDDTIEESTRLAFERYREALMAWNSQSMQSKVEGDRAEVTFAYTIVGSKQDVTFWMMKTQGIWRVEDFTIAGKRFSGLVTRLAEGLANLKDLTGILKGKDLFTALAQLGQPQDAPELFREKTLVEHYVRLRSPQTFMKGKETIQLEAGKIVKVIDEWTTDLLVRTPEADVRASAMAKIPADSVEVVGTDESEMWGTNTGS